MRFLVVAVVSLVLPAYCAGSVFRFDDLTDQISVTIDGVPIANGGRVSNLAFAGESVSFDLLVNGTTNVLTQTLFTRLLEPPAGDGDSVGTNSDILLLSFVNNQPTYHVTFGSDPDLPTVPPNARDLTTLPAQGLPPNPYYEDGTFQKMGTAFFSDNSEDTFFVRSDVPEPGSFALLAGGVSVLAVLRRKRSS